MWAFLIFIALITILVLYIGYLLVQFIIMRVISKALKVKIEPDKQNGLFSFEGLKMTNEYVIVNAERVRVSLNPFHILSGKNHLFCADIRKLNITLKPGYEKLYTTGKSTKAEEPLDTEAKFSYQAISYALILAIRSFDITISELNFNYGESIELKNKGIRLGFKRSKAIIISLDLGETSLILEKNRYAVKPFNLSINVSLDFVGHYFNPYISAFYIVFSIDNIGIASNGNTITMPLLDFNANGSPGDISIKITPISAEIPISLPDFNFTIGHMDLKSAIPLSNPPNCKFHHLDLSVKDFNVKFVTEKFLNINQFNVMIEDIFNFSFTGSIDKLIFDYSTLDGLQVFQFVKMARSPIYTPLRIKFAFPDGSAKINSIDLHLRLTDKAIVRGTADNVEYKDHGIYMPKLRAYVNDFNLITATDFIIHSPDQEYLTFSATRLAGKHRNKVDVAEFIDEAVCGWRIIKPLASANIFDSETLPFPIRAKVKTVSLKFYATTPASHLCKIYKILPKQFRDNIVLDYIFKIKSKDLSEDQLKLAQEKLPYLKFENFKKSLEGVDFPKYLAHLIAHDVDIKLDSREYTGMVQKIMDCDEPTNQYYRDTQWETLEGFRVDAKVGTFETRSLDLPEPYIETRNANLKGDVTIAENKDGNKINVPVTVLGQEFITQATATDVKMYCDLSLIVDYFRLRIGGHLMKIFDDFSDCISKLIPDGPDPSASLKWWDKMRYMFRGKYNLCYQTVRVEFMGNGSYYDMGDFITLRLTDGIGKLTDGQMYVKCAATDLVRNENGVLVAHLPNFETTLNLIWDTLSHNQKLHMCESNPSRWGDPTYDMYNQFRATACTWGFTFSFSKDDVDPFIAVDIPHFFWLIQPFNVLFNTPFLLESYYQKYHAQRTKPRAKLYYFGQMPMNFVFNFNDISSLSIRVYDQFPVPEEKIGGSSFDATVVNFTCNFTMDMPAGQSTIYNVSLRADNIMINATDLPTYDKYSENQSITFLSIYDVVGNYGNVSSLSVSGIKIYMNYVFLNYINEFCMAIMHFVKDGTEEPKPPMQNDGEVFRPAAHERNISMMANKTCSNSDLLTTLKKRRNSEITVSLTSAKKATKEKIDYMKHFTVEVLTVNIPKIQIVIQSLQFNVRLLAYVDELKIKCLKDEQTNMYGSDFSIKSVWMKDNLGFDPSDNDRNDVILNISNISLLYHEEGTSDNSDNYIEAAVDMISGNATSDQVSTLKQIIKEMTPPIPEKPKDDLKKFDLDQNPVTTFINIQLAKLTLVLIGQDSSPMMLLSAFDASADLVYASDDSVDSTIVIKEFLVNDMRINSSAPRVIERWAEKSGNKDEPLFRMQSKKTAPVGGISVYSHVELNVQPMIVDYYSVFFDQVIKMIISKVKLVSFEKIVEEHVIKDVVKVRFTPLNVNSGILPSLEKKNKEIVNDLHNTDVSVMIERSNDNFLLRYFKITQVNLLVSYHNPENSIIPNIKSFHGVLHDINIQDLTATFELFVGRLTSEISKDVIPQFLKYFIGLGKVQPHTEKELSLWLGDNPEQDIQKVADSKKQLLFGSVRGRK